MAPVGTLKFGQPIGRYEATRGVGRRQLMPGRAETKIACRNLLLIRATSPTTCPLDR